VATISNTNIYTGSVCKRSLCGLSGQPDICCWAKGPAKFKNFEITPKLNYSIFNYYIWQIFTWNLIFLKYTKSAIKVSILPGIKAMLIYIIMKTNWCAISRMWHWYTGQVPYTTRSPSPPAWVGWFGTDHMILRCSTTVYYNRDIGCLISVHM